MPALDGASSVALLSAITYKDGQTVHCRSADEGEDQRDCADFEPRCLVRSLAWRGQSIPLLQNAPPSSVALDENG